MEYYPDDEPKLKALSSQINQMLKSHRKEEIIIKVLKDARAFKSSERYSVN